MHVFDRTLLAKLGFADPDKGDARHDRACQYLATDAISTKLISFAFRRSFGHRIGKQSGRDFRGIVEVDDKQTRIGSAILEKPLSKGEGQYKTTIGFLDVAIAFQIALVFKGEQFCWRTTHDDGRWEATDRTSMISGFLYVEVKVGPVGIGQALRQINLYREYLGNSMDDIWVLATVFPMAPKDIASLESADILHVRLGEGFSLWEASIQEDDSVDDEPEGLDSFVL